MDEQTILTHGQIVDSIVFDALLLCSEDIDTDTFMARVENTLKDNLFEEIQNEMAHHKANPKSPL